jgi:Thioredoxin like C-terminal domain
VLTGHGYVVVKVNGKLQGTVRIDGDRLYTLYAPPRTTEATLDLSFTPGLSAYAFTFG